MIKCIAVEDEPMAMRKLTGFIKDTPFLELQAQFSNSLDALNYLTQQTTDLVFLDIQMDKLNGIQLLESLQIKPKVIIISAYNQYAVKGYELEVIDYILKPYPFERFLQAANKAQKQIQNFTQRRESRLIADVIFIKTAYQIEKVLLDDILYIEGMKDYLGIIIKEKRLMCLQNFTALLNVLPESDFVRVHKSYVIALNKIETISNHRIRIGEKLIPISDTYQKAFYTSLRKYRKIL